LPKIICGWMLCKYNTSKSYGQDGNCECPGIHGNYTVRLNNINSMMLPSGEKIDGLYCSNFSLDLDKLNIKNINNGKIFTLIQIINQLQIGQEAKLVEKDIYINSYSCYSQELSITRKKDTFILNYINREKTLELIPDLMKLDWIILPDFKNGTWIK